MASLSNGGLNADVIVIGGGPGGSTASTMLARKGLRVLLLERDRFPRDHVGESLLPASIPVLGELGVLPAIQEAGFLPKWGATMVWGRESAPWSWYFKETNRNYPHSYQVWRPTFDHLLLENSRANGVTVCEGCHVVGVLFEDGKATGVQYSTEDASCLIARADFIVDASGQSGLLGRQLRLRRWDPYFRNLAVYGYFTGARRLLPPDETNIFIESYPHGWFWNIPLHTGWASVGAVVDSHAAQDEVRRRGLHGFLVDQIAQAPNITHMLRESDMVSGPFIVKDWSYASEQVVGDGYILVGDAACFVDPLFSSGVHLALMSGVMAAAYVTSALKDTSMREAAGQVYRELYYKEYGHFREMARLFYSSNRTSDSYFWEARRILEADDLSPRHAFIQAVAGQPPRGYERVVLDRGEAPGEYLASVRTVERERAGRRGRLEASKLRSDGILPSLHGVVPILAPGVGVERKPVIADGEFEWGHVLTTPGRPEGIPCSGLVAKIVSLIDGRTPASDILTALRGDGQQGGGAQLDQSVMATLQILYVDGTIEDLQGL
ncbi:MAG: tryptophan 7-halogenase [Dehalococcoidia bacterium]|nr:tryptophan 7-halogenase [Dehalococcoidia bacterium]